MQLDELRRIPLFATATDEALQELLLHAPSHERTYSTGDLIAMQGFKVKSLLILSHGSVRAQMTSSEGKRLTIDTLTAPALLAPAFVYGTDNTFPVSIEAIEHTEIWSLDREYLLGYMGRHTSVMRAFLQIISDRSNFLSQRLNSMGLQSLRERLISYLRQHRVVGKQEELALVMGVARPSLARLIGELVDEGILIKEGGTYRLAR